MKYKLIEPTKKPLAERMPFYLFAAVLSSFMLWIVLIRPMTLPADQMPFIFEYNEQTKEVYPEEQKRTYFLLTGGAILGAGLMMIPVVRNGNRFDYFMAKLWANREYLDDGEFSKLCDKVNHKMWLPNNVPECLNDLQQMVDKNGGKHITGRKYFKKEYWKDLEPAK